MEQLLSAIEVLPLGVTADEEYGRLRAARERRGTPIGANDCLTAPHALSEALSPVTADFAEFSLVPGLAVENWLGS